VPLDVVFVEEVLYENKVHPDEFIAEFMDDILYNSSGWGQVLWHFRWFQLGPGLAKLIEKGPPYFGDELLGPAGSEPNKISRSARTLGHPTSSFRPMHIPMRMNLRGERKPQF
jgi:hypothetical protein